MVASYQKIVETVLICLFPNKNQAVEATQNTTTSTAERSQNCNLILSSFFGLEKQKF